MGELYRRKGDFYEAGLYFNEARSIAVEIQDRETEGHALSNLGLAYQSAGELDLALDCFEKALNIFAETNYRSDAEVEALSGIAQIKWAQNEVEEAKRYYEMAVLSGGDLGLWHLTAAGLRCLAARLREALSAVEHAVSSPGSDGDRVKMLKEEILQEIERSQG
jgi:tetratricopeptide (TPR) repeat protein